MRLRLTPEEKAAMKARIFSLPAPAGPTPSPYVAFSFSLRRVLVPALAAVLAVGVGTASAAQGALPGDLLYPVKVSVNERVEVALARTPAQKAAIEATLAARRVSEAQALLEQGRLTASTTDEIEKNFDEHASRALALADKADVADAQESGSARDASSTAARAPQTLSITATPPATPNVHEEDDASSRSESTRFSIRIRASLDAQAHVLRTLKLHVDTSGDAREEHRASTSTQGRKSGEPKPDTKINQTDREPASPNQKDNESASDNAATTTPDTAPSSGGMSTTTDGHRTPEDSGSGGDGHAEGSAAGAEQTPSIIPPVVRTLLH